MKLTNRIMVICTIAISSLSSISFAGPSVHDAHPKGQQSVTAKIRNIVYFENGMTLMLDREISPKESCVHIENAASFSAKKLEKIERAKSSSETITMEISDGHVVDVTL